MSEAKFKVDGDVLAASLECPVCFNVPREVSIPQCPSGHIAFIVIIIIYTVRI